MATTTNATGLSRTRKAIIAALLVLMATDAFADITVTQIVQRAEVARRTFYLNYASKEDVLRDCISQQAADYTARLEASEKRTVESDVSAFFSYWAAQTNLLVLLHENGLFPLLLDTYEQILNASDAFPYLRPEPKAGMTADGVAARVRFTSIIAATVLWRIQLEWVRTGMHESPGELTAIALELAPYAALM